jgi:hypothetical protein
VRRKSVSCESSEPASTQCGQEEGVESQKNPTGKSTTKERFRSRALSEARRLKPLIWSEPLN